MWEDVFYALTGSSGVVGTTSADSTHIKAHRSAGGAKGGLRQRNRPISRRTDDQESCPNGCGRPAVGPLPHAEAGARPRRPRQGSAAGADAATPDR